MKLLLVIPALLLTLHTADAGEAITISELRDHISYLASDELKGRKPGTEGGRLAAEYIREQLREMNLQFPADDGFQYFDVVVDASAAPSSSLSFDDYEAVFGQHFLPVAFSPDTLVTADVVFAGYGLDISTDSLKWQDYAGIDVSGKYAMILRGAPDRDEPAYDPYISLRKKVLVARDHGAAGVLFVSGRTFDEEDALMEISVDQARIPAGLQTLHIKRALADSMLKGTGQTIALLEERLIAEMQPYSLPVAVKVTARTSIDKKHVKARNVVAFLGGSNPDFKDEYIILGAHYDHLGMGGPGSGSRRPDTLAIHNGADDNASGTAAIIEIMERLAANRERLKRSVLFVAFDGEELGLLGSRHYTEHPLHPLEQARLMFNLDMVGNYEKDSEAVTIGGTGTATGLGDMVLSTAAHHKMEIRESPEGHGPSDHASFYAKDIPVLFFFSGTTEYYHTPGDDVELIEFDGLKSIADLIYDMALEIINSDVTLAFQEAGPKERPGGERYKFKVTLGIMPDIAASGIDGLRAELVMDGRPADEAGMKKGDIIVAMEGKPVHNIYDYMNRLQEFKKGQRISVDVMRDGEKKVLIVEL